MKYCPCCDKTVMPMKKPFSMAWFLVWTVLSAGSLILVYPFYYICFVGKQCPMCNGTRFLSKKPVPPVTVTVEPTPIEKVE